MQSAAVFRSGSDDDSRIYLDLPGFVELTGIEPNTALVRVDGRPAAFAQEMNAIVAAHLQIMVRGLVCQLQKEPFRLGGIAGALGLFGAIPERITGRCGGKTLIGCRRTERGRRT